MTSALTLEETLVRVMALTQINRGAQEARRAERSKNMSGTQAAVAEVMEQIAGPIDPRVPLLLALSEADVRKFAVLALAGCYEDDTLAEVAMDGSHLSKDQTIRYLLGSKGGKLDEYLELGWAKLIKECGTDLDGWDPDADFEEEEGP